eukprot:GILJ01008823.1.p2 GENE.GILJ01008823.1~~GILJ01008823.1.p2  ORF type:complete len:436 (-),score=65.68 GILJ01008823.1:2219-3526(-)
MFWSRHPDSPIFVGSTTERGYVSTPTYQAKRLKPNPADEHHGSVTPNDSIARHFDFSSPDMMMRKPAAAPQHDIFSFRDSNKDTSFSSSFHLPALFNEDNMDDEEEPAVDFAAEIRRQIRQEESQQREDEINLQLAKLQIHTENKQLPTSEQLDDTIHARMIYREKEKKMLAVMGHLLPDVLEDLIDEVVWEEVGAVKNQMPLTDAEEEKAKKILFTGAPNDVLISKFNVDLTRDKIRCLKDATWLNDEIINFYFKLLGERNRIEVEKFGRLRIPKCYYQTTFFYAKLVENGYNYQSVRRWTTRQKVDIFDTDKMIVPVNLSQTHWCIAVIDFRIKEILYIDSMWGSNEACLNALLKYLVDEYKDKKGGDLDTTMWRKRNAKSSVPRQSNGYDCGMFICKFAECVSEDRSWDFDQSQMRTFRKRMVLELISANVI